MSVYKEDVDKIIFRTRTEILDLKEKLDKYKEKVSSEIDAKEGDLKTLEEVVKDLPERQPKLFDGLGEHMAIEMQFDKNGG